MKTLLPAENRHVNWIAVIEVCLLSTTGVMLIAKAVNGVLAYYVHPRYTPLIIACGVSLLLIACARIRSVISREPESLHGRHTQYLLLLVPLLLGTLVPARPLGANALSGSVFDTSAFTTSAPLATEDTQHWNVLQWAMALSYQGAELNGRTVDVTGFVYHDLEQQLDGFILVRYVITCCTADSNGVRLPISWPDAVTVQTDDWVRVRGTIGTAVIGDRPEQVVFATSVEHISQPEMPYLYP